MGEYLTALPAVTPLPIQLMSEDIHYPQKMEGPVGIEPT